MTTTETTAPDYITLVMSERRPLKIDRAMWPTIASVERHDGAVECQANRKWYIRVRQHADGRRIVTGGLVAGNGGMHAHEREVRAGYLIPTKDRETARIGADGMATVAWPDDDETIRAIRRVGGVIDDDQLAAECIADLPAEEI